MSLTDLRTTLITRLVAAHGVAQRKGVPTLTAACTVKLRWLATRCDMDLPYEVDGVDDLIGDIHRAGTMDQIREAYALSRSALGAVLVERARAVA